MEEYLSEKEQWEQLKAWVRENGLWIIAGIAVGGAALGGWRWYQDRVDSLGAQASAKYSQMLQAIDRNDRGQTFMLLGEIERDYATSPYMDQARLMAARVDVDSGELDKALAELKAVTEHTKDPELALVARLRLARIEIAQNKADAALATLNGLKPGAFEPRYHEILGDAYFAKGDKPNALKEYLKAKVGDFAGASGSQLDLKISDLSADNPPPVAQATTPPLPAATAAAK